MTEEWRKERKRRYDKLIAEVDEALRWLEEEVKRLLERRA